MPALRTKKESESLSPSDTSSPASGLTPVSKIKEAEDAKNDSPRRSGRKYKQRVLFGHEKVQQTPSPSTSKKTKLPKKTVEKPDSDEEEEDSSSDEEIPESSSEDEEEVITPRKAPPKRKKTAPATPKTDPFGKKGRTPSKTTPGRKRKAKATIQEDEDQGTLFDIVKAGKGALRAVVDDWIESYNKDKEAAMVDIIQFFVQCCGCKGTVTGSMLDEDENVDAVRQLTEQFDEESHEYPLVMSGPSHKKFKTNFVAFVHTLIVQCQHSIIYDEYMLDTLVSWLIRLSDSQVRAFRHTSTLAEGCRFDAVIGWSLITIEKKDLQALTGMKLVSALIHIAKNVHIELDNTQRQLDSETQKSTSKKALEKIDMLQTRRQELRQNINDLEEMMNFIFQGMFVHRYRDSRPEIRALCISEIGEWMKEYSTLFLNDRYLKYIVWNLHDKVGEVRLKSVQALLGLYGDEDLVPHLDALTTRFKDRFVSMTLDKDNEVAVEAVKLMSYLYQYDKLDEEDCQQVQLLVFCTHKQVAHAAGQFLYKRIRDAAEDDIKSSKSKKGSKKTDKEAKVVQLKKLLEFFINSEVHNHGAYLVDSLWNTAPLIKDWKLMTDMLLDKADEAGLDDKDEEALIEIMVSSCKQSSQGQGPTGRVVRKVLSNKEKKTIISDKKELSAHFMQALPDLLAKYGTDNEKVHSLVSLPQFFDLEEYGQRRLGKYLEELLNQLDSVVEKCTDPMVLQECAKTYRSLTDSEYTLSTTAEVCRNKLVDQFVEAFKGSLRSGLDVEGDEEDNNDRFVLISNLEKISAFYKAHDLGSWKLYDNLNHVMHHATTDQDAVPDKIVILVINAMQCLLLWNLSGLDVNHPDKAQLKKLKKWSSTFIRQCEELVGYSNTEVRIEALLCVCDLLIVFAKQLKNQSPLLGSLVYEPNDPFQATCRDFIINHIFDNIDEDEPEEEDDEQTDEKVEELSRKRTMLAAFLKLVIYNVFDMGLAASVFSFLNKAFSDYGDIIKHAMNKCKEINKTLYAKTLLAALQQEFLTLKDEQEGEIDVKSEEFGIIKDLAHRFALSLGVDTTKSQAREALITLHREGIQYALSKSAGKKQSPKKGNVPPPNLPFFDILNEFTFRLIPQDKTGRSGVLPFLNKEAGDKVEMKGDEWSPLITYRNNLLGNQEGEEENEQQKQDKSKSARANPKKSLVSHPVQGKGKKRQASPEEEDEDSADDTAPLKRTKKIRGDIGQTPVEAEKVDEAGEESGEESGLEEKEKPQKRKRQESEHSETREGEEGDEDFESSGVPSSQKSWMASQTKASKRPRISYSRKDRDKSSHPTLEDDKEEDEQNIEEYESEEESEPKKKAPFKVRREKLEIPENLFEDSQENKSTEDDSTLDEPAI